MSRAPIMPGQADDKGGSLADLRVEFQSAVHLFDELLADVQTQPGLLLLGAEERPKDLVPNCVLNAGARVGHLHDCVATIEVTVQPDPPALGHGLLGVQHQIDEDLVEMHRVRLGRDF